MAVTSSEKYELETDGFQISLRLKGDWCFAAGVPPADQLMPQLAETRNCERLSFHTEQLGKWDSGLMIFLTHLLDDCKQRQLTVDLSGLPTGVQNLLRLATVVPERKGARRKVLGLPMLTKVGNVTIELHRGWSDLLIFVGEIVIALWRMLRGRARFRKSDLFYQIEGAGPSALAIITLISTLVGMILAFVGAVQLRQFGAQIYIADLVGLGMAREMGAMMTAIIMAGRTGAAFAAQLGTMQVNEEIDALQTMGISPIEFLVLPRLLALSFTMPLLCVYSDFMGIVGGGIVSASMLDISFFQYFQQIQSAVPLKHFMVGITKAGIFGVLVATAGCFRGIQCGRSAAAVGYSATRAVVTSIVLIVVADALVTLICQILGW